MTQSHLDDFYLPVPRDLNSVVKLWLPGRPMTKKNKRIKHRYTGKWINPADHYEQILRDHAVLLLQNRTLPIFPDERLAVIIEAFIQLVPTDVRLPDTANIPEAILDAMQEKRSRDRKAIIRHGILYTNDRQIDILIIRRRLKPVKSEGVEITCWAIS